MLVFKAISKQEHRRMQLIGIPLLIVVLVSAITMDALCSILFLFVALIPYSFFYIKAYAVVAARSSSPPGWRFYTGVVLVQLVFIAVLVARVWA